MLQLDGVPKQIGDEVVLIGDKGQNLYQSMRLPGVEVRSIMKWFAGWQNACPGFTSNKDRFDKS